MRALPSASPSVEWTGKKPGDLGRGGLFHTIVVLFVFRKFYNLLMKTQ